MENNEMNITSLDELTKAFTDRNVVRNDMKEAADTVKKMLMDKYIARMHNIVTAKSLQTQRNPSKEVMLMRAAREFMPPEKRSSIENAISALSMLDTMDKIKKDLPGSNNINHPVKAASKRPVENANIDIEADKFDESVHLDGIYDIDVNCLRNMHGGPQGADKWLKFIMLMLLARK